MFRAVSDCCHYFEPRTRPLRRVFALATSIMFIGCNVTPSKVTATPTERNFSALGCEQLAGETKRIEAAYEDIRFSNEAGTRRKVSVLNGEVHAVNDAIRINGCKLPDARIPGHAWPETRKRYASSPGS